MYTMIGAGHHVEMILGLHRVVTVVVRRVVTSIMMTGTTTLRVGVRLRRVSVLVRWRLHVIRIVVMMLIAILVVMSFRWWVVDIVIPVAAQIILDIPGNS